jgi:peptide/nickel transport system substrate-binding protein
MAWCRSLGRSVVASGAGLAVAATLAAGGTSVPAGGELRAVSAADVDSLDPALVQEPLGWNIVLASCTTLFVDGPGSGTPRLVPEAAVGFPAISKDGLTYVFTIRRRLRFADGTPLTAAAFARAIGRVLDPRMHAPAAPGFASAITGVHARANRLTIRLAHPRGELVALLTMPWACPVPPGLPVDPTGVDRIPGSGPYNIVEHLPGRQIVLRRNPFYLGPRPQRPEKIVIRVGGTPDANVQAVESGSADIDLDLALPSVQAPPPQLLADLAARYGVGRRQFFIRPFDSTVFLAMNTSRPLFHDNAPLSRAVNYALDRPEIVRQGGPLAGHRTDHLLPTATLGFHNVLLYPLGGPDLRLARQLARGHLRGAKAVLYVPDAPVGLRRAAIIRYNLAQIGLDVEVRSFARAVLLSKVSTRGEPFDLVLTGWTGFTLDPADFLVRLLDGRGITTNNNFNLSYFNVSAVNRQLAEADALPAPRRYKTFAALEVRILQRYAPVAPIMNPLAYILVSSRVRCFAYDAFGGFNLGSACLA